MSKYSQCCVCTTQMLMTVIWGVVELGCPLICLVDCHPSVDSMHTNPHKHHRSVNHNALFTSAGEHICWLLLMCDQNIFNVHSVLWDWNVNDSQFNCANHLSIYSIL